MPDSYSNARDHLRKFFHIVDIADDLLTVMMLYGLPSSYENFRCAIESRDELPKPEALRIKIIQESDARRDDRQLNESGAFNASHLQRKSPWKNKRKKNNGRNKNQKNKDISKIVFWKCKNACHYSSQCELNNKYSSNYKKNNLGLLASINYITHAFSMSSESIQNMWCIDSGCTKHLCNDKSKFMSISDSDISSKSLANNEITEVSGCGTVSIKAGVNSTLKNVPVYDTLFVPELKTNLSVSKLCDKGYTVTFKENYAVITNYKNIVQFITDRKDDLFYLRISDSNVNIKFC